MLGQVLLLQSLTSAATGMAITDAAGRYVFFNIQPGTYKVMHEIPSGYVNTTGSAPGTSTQTVVLGGASLLNVDFGYYKARPNLSVTGLTLRRSNSADACETHDGDEVDNGDNLEQGEPIAVCAQIANSGAVETSAYRMNAFLHLTAQPTAERMGQIFYSTSTVANFTTSDYQVGSVSKGYHLRPDPNVCSLDCQVALFLDSQNTLVESSEADNFFTSTAVKYNVVGPCYPKLCGRITAAEGGSIPLEGVVVELRNAENRMIRKTKTLPDGSYEFDAPAQPVIIVPAVGRTQTASPGQSKLITMDGFKQDFKIRGKQTNIQVSGVANSMVLIATGTYSGAPPTISVGASGLPTAYSGVIGSNGMVKVPVSPGNYALTCWTPVICSGQKTYVRGTAAIGAVTPDMTDASAPHPSCPAPSCP